MIFNKRDSLVFPLDAIRGICNHPKSQTESVETQLISLIGLQREERREVEHAARRSELTRRRRCMPNPAPLLGMGPPVVFAHAEGRTGGAIVNADPMGMVAMDHVKTPSAISHAPEMQQVANDVASDGAVGVIDIAKSGISE